MTICANTLKPELACLLIMNHDWHLPKPCHSLPIFFIPVFVFRVSPYQCVKPSQPSQPSHHFTLISPYDRFYHIKKKTSPKTIPMYPFSAMIFGTEPPLIIQGYINTSKMVDTFYINHPIVFPFSILLIIDY